jgi:hypothetical protein
MAFEEEFKVEIDDNSAAEIRTVQDAINYIENLYLINNKIYYFFLIIRVS